MSLETQHGRDKSDAACENFLSNNVWLYLIIGICLGVLMNPTLEALDDSISTFLRDLLPEGVGVLFTVFILERLNHRERIAAEKRDLLAQMSSPDNSVTRQAIKIMWARGWLQSGVAKGANLWDADLEGADLGECDLRDVNLWIANLRDARLWADLRGANLYQADLSGAMFTSHWGGATFDPTTKLPDGTFWQSDTDMSRFTNPNHPEFWRSSDRRSPAFVGDT